MPIKRRFESTPVDPETYQAEHSRPVRETFNLNKDPFHGSFMQAMGLEKDNARAVTSHLAYVANPFLPSNMRTQDLLAQLRLPDNPGDETEKRYRERIVSPLTAIRGYCVECKGGSPKAVNMCDKMECPMWAFRLGQNAYYKRK